MIVATLRLGLAPGTLCLISGTWRNANVWDRL